MVPSVVIAFALAVLAQPVTSAHVVAGVGDGERPQASAPQMPGMNMPKGPARETASRWMLMGDGSLTLMLNDQGGPRGGT
jgi:hypothetical protein